jgi:hypothetical protein
VANGRIYFIKDDYSEILGPRIASAAGLLSSLILRGAGNE